MRAGGGRRTALRRIRAGRPPRPIRRRLVRRAAPAAGAQLAVGPVAFGAALGTPPRGDPLRAAFGQIAPVRLPFGPRMRFPVAILRVRQSPPASPARAPIGPVPAPAALDAQPGSAVPGAGAERSWR